MKALNLVPALLMLALGLPALAQSSAGALPVTTPDQAQADLVPQAPNEEAEQAAAAAAQAPVDPSMPVEAPQESAAAEEAAPPVAEAPAPRKHKEHVKTAKEQLAFDKKLQKDTKSKIAKVLKEERQGDKDLKKAKAAVKAAQAKVKDAEKKVAKIQSSLKGYEKTRMALEKTLKKTNIAVTKDTKKANRMPASR